MSLNESNPAFVRSINGANVIPFNSPDSVVGAGLGKYPYYDSTYRAMRLYPETSTHIYNADGSLKSPYNDTGMYWQFVYLPVNPISCSGDLAFACNISSECNTELRDADPYAKNPGHYVAWRKGGIGKDDTWRHTNNDHWYSSRLGNSTSSQFGCYLSTDAHLGRVPRMRNEVLAFAECSPDGQWDYSVSFDKIEGISPMFAFAKNEDDRYNVVYNPNPVTFPAAPSDFSKCITIGSEYKSLESALKASLDVTSGRMEPSGITKEEFIGALKSLSRSNVAPVYVLPSGTKPKCNDLKQTSYTAPSISNFSITDLTLYKNESPDMYANVNHTSQFIQFLREFIGSTEITPPQSLIKNSSNEVLCDPIIGLPSTDVEKVNSYCIHLLRCFNNAVTAACNGKTNVAKERLKDMFIKDGQLYNEGISSFFIPKLMEHLGVVQAFDAFGHLKSGTQFFPGTVGITTSMKVEYAANAKEFTCGSVPNEDELSRIVSWGIPRDKSAYVFGSTIAVSNSFLSSHISPKTIWSDNSSFAHGGDCVGGERKYVGTFSVPFDATLYINSSYCTRKHCYYSNGISRDQTVNPCCYGVEVNGGFTGWGRVLITNACMARFGYDCFYFDWQAVREKYLKPYAEKLASSLSSPGITVTFVNSTDNYLGAINRRNGYECKAKYLTKQDVFLKQDPEFRIARQVNLNIGKCSSDEYCGYSPTCCVCGPRSWRTQRTSLYVPRDELLGTGKSISEVLTAAEGASNEDKLRFMENDGFSKDGKRILKNTFVFDVSFRADVHANELCPYAVTKSVFFFTKDVHDLYVQCITSGSFLDRLLDSIRPDITETCYKLAYLDRLVKPFLETVDTSVLLFDLPLGPPAMHNTETNILSFQYYMGEYEFPKGKDVTDMTIYERGVDKDTYLDATLVDMLQKEAMMIPVSEVPYTKDGKRVNADLDKVSIVVKIPENASRLLTIPRISVDKKPLSYITYTNESYNGKPSGAESITDSTCLVFNVLGPKTAGEKRMNGDYETLDGKLTVPMVSIKTESVESDRSWTVSISSVDMYCHASKGKLNTSTIGGNSLAFSYLDGVSWTDKAFMEPGLFETV